jgi:hypothetical protein
MRGLAHVFGAFAMPLQAAGFGAFEPTGDALVHSFFLTNIK